MRWVVALLCLLLIPLYPWVAWPPIVGLALVLGVGNALVTRLLHAGFRPERQRTVSRMAMSLESGMTLVGIGLFAGVPESNSLAVLLVLEIHVGLRFGQPGIVLAVAASEIVVGLVVAAQVLLLRVVDMTDATREWAGWAAWVLLMAVVTSAFVHAGHRWRHWQEDIWLQQRASARRLEHQISPREWEVLPLLACPDLTYEQIGQALSISPDTVKSHTRRIGAKLGVTGRQAVVTAAREQDLLPTVETGSVSDDSSQYTSNVGHLRSESNDLRINDACSIRFTEG